MTDLNIQRYEEIVNHVTANKQLYSNVIQSTIFVRDEFNLKNFRTRFYCVPKGENIKPRGTVIFQPVVFFETELTIDEFLSSLKLILTGQLMAGPEKIPLSGVSFAPYDFHSADNYLTKHAGIIFQVHHGDVPQMPNQFISADADFYFLDVDHAVREWLGVTWKDSPFINKTPALDGITIFLPTEAHINLITKENGELIFHIQKVTESTRFVRGYVWLEIEKGFSFKKRVENDKAILSVQEPVRDIEVQLVDSNGTLLDLARQYDFKQGRRFEGVTEPNKEELSQLIKKGENTLVEFKCFFAPDTDKDKSHEVANTIIAFSNTQGGKIIIGVTDNLEVQDITRLRKCIAVQGSLEEVTDAFAARLQKTLRKNFLLGDSDLKYSIKNAEFYGSYLIVIDVEKGTKIHEDKAGVTWFRRGAHTVQPDFAEFEELVILKNKHPRLLF